MNLQSGDFIISPRSPQETWDLILPAIKSFSDEHGTWNIVQDLQSDRVTATMSYREGERQQKKRTLMLEINAYPKQDHTRLELRYSIWPDYDQEVGQQILGRTVDSIAEALGASAQPSNLPGAVGGGVKPPVVISGDSELPAELLEVGKAGGGEMVMNVIEVGLVLAFLLAVWNPWVFAIGAFFGFPAFVVSWSVRDFKKYSVTKWKGKDLPTRLLFFTPDIILRLTATAIAMPFIALGLCAGAFLLSTIFGGGRIAG